MTINYMVEYYDKGMKTEMFDSLEEAQKFFDIVAPKSSKCFLNEVEVKVINGEKYYWYRKELKNKQSMKKEGI